MSDRLPDPDRRSGELGFVELLRWMWRQLTSMRTALVLLLLLALAAIPGSVIPQSNVDSLKTSRWQSDHPDLTPIYERLQLFSVYDSVWFSAIYILLMISLVGCIVPRCLVYFRALQDRPPRTPRNLSRLPDHVEWSTERPEAEVLADAAAVLSDRRYRVDTHPDSDSGSVSSSVSAEKGYLREAGNLLFHLSVLVVLVGFAVGGLFGYKGGVIVLVGGGFSNNLTQYDDFDPGGLFDPDAMEPFSFTVDKFDAEWLVTGPKAGMARKFASDLTYTRSPDSNSEKYELKVNHPLSIGGTEIFLIGHGYAPVFTIRDGDGNVAFSGPVIFLPTDQNFGSFGVVKVPDAKPTQIGLQGGFYPTYAFTQKTGPYSAFGNAVNPKVSLLAYTGDLGLDSGAPQSVYALDTDRLKVLKKADGSMFRVDLAPGETVKLPEGAGSVTFDKVERWNKVQISRTPGKLVALGGVCLALLGLLGSLFIRPRRVWVRVRSGDGVTLVELAGLDRSGGGDTASELSDIMGLIKAKETT